MSYVSHSQPVRHVAESRRRRGELWPSRDRFDFSKAAASRSALRQQRRPRGRASRLAERPTLMYSRGWVSNHVDHDPADDGSTRMMANPIIRPTPGRIGRLFTTPQSSIDNLKRLKCGLILKSRVPLNNNHPVLLFQPNAGIFASSM